MSALDLDYSAFDTDMPDPPNGRPVKRRGNPAARAIPLTIAGLGIVGSLAAAIFGDMGWAGWAVAAFVVPSCLVFGWFYLSLIGSSRDRAATLRAFSGANGFVFRGSTRAPEPVAGAATPFHTDVTNIVTGEIGSQVFVLHDRRWRGRGAAPYSTLVVKAAGTTEPILAVHHKSLLRSPFLNKPKRVESQVDGFTLHGTPESVGALERVIAHPAVQDVIAHSESCDVELDGNAIRLHVRGRYDKDLLARLLAVVAAGPLIA